MKATANVIVLTCRPANVPKDYDVIAKLTTGDVIAVKNHYISEIVDNQRHLNDMAEGD